MDESGDDWQGFASEEDAQEQEQGGEQEQEQEQKMNVDFEQHPGNHISKPPTGEELRKIKDATDLYRSTSFKLQVCSTCSCNSRALN